MANEFDVSREGDYQLTNAYRDASRDRRRQLNRYKKECNISDEHMFLLMMQQDLKNVPKSKQDSSDLTGKGLLVVGVLLFWNSMTAALNAEAGFNMYLWAIAFVSFLMVIVVYFTGMVNPYKRAVRQVNKYLKEMPEVPSFDEWMQQRSTAR